MNDKTSLDIIKEMTQRFVEATKKFSTITERRYQYSKDECETIFNNIFKAVDEYTKKADSDDDAYERLLISLADRFKISSTGGDISRQVDSLSSAEDLYENQSKFQEMLDSARDVIEFITDKSDKLEGTSIRKTSDEKIVEPTDTSDENKEPEAVLHDSSKE